MDEDLRRRALLSVQRALVGEIAPEMMAIAVLISQERIKLLLYVEEGTAAEVVEDFDAGAVTQVVADFPYPETGSPAVRLEALMLPIGSPIPHVEDQVFVFARTNVRFLRD